MLFNALIADLVDQAEQIGIDIIKFRLSINSKRESLPRAAQMVVVSADTVFNPGFLIYIDRLWADRLL